MTIVALCGEVGAGKDTVADLLLDQLGALGVKAASYRIAQPIKDSCVLLGIDPDNRKTKEVEQTFCIDCGDLTNVIYSEFPYLTKPQQYEVVCSVWAKLVNCPRNRDMLGGFIFSPRQFQQWLGQAVRDVCCDYYVQAALAFATKHPDTLVVIPDCRFMNEVGIAHTSVYITRPDNPYRINTTDVSEAAQEKLKAYAEFQLVNAHPCGESWEDSLSYAVEALIAQLTLRGYLDDVSTTDAD